MRKKLAIIVDRDGTLARVDRSFFDGEKPDWTGFHLSLPFDSPVPAIVQLTQSIHLGIEVLITTGRGEELRWPMTGWLEKHRVRWDDLFMRALGDHRPDHEVKRELYEKYIEPYYEVLYVVDDREEVCDMWRELGLPLIQVAQPEEIPPFEFLGAEDGD